MEKGGKNIFLGLWFQRTSLHLKEFYDFLIFKDLVYGLNPEECKKLNKNLGITKLEIDRTKGVNLLKAQSGDIDFSMTEDGTVLIHTTTDDLKDASNKLKLFYTEKLSPALTYLFSKGAPLPKDLSDLKEIYPLYLFGYELDNNFIDSYFKFFSDSPFLTDHKDGVEIITGEELVVVNVFDFDSLKDESFAQDFLRNIVIFREFEKQLSRYLVLHRKIWERVDSIRQLGSLSPKKFSKIRGEILEHLKTLSFVKARLSQMEDILITREASLGSKDKEILIKTEMFGRFQVLKSEQKYILDLWDMTADYTKGTLDLLDSLIAENTQKEIGVLQFITFIGVATGFFGMNIPFPWNPEWASLFEVSFVVCGVILLFSIIIRFVLKINLYKKIKIK